MPALLQLHTALCAASLRISFCNKVTPQLQTTVRELRTDADAAAAKAEGFESQARQLRVAAGRAEAAHAAQLKRCQQASALQALSG